MLMEKAYAKLYGTFTKVEAGASADAFEAMLGCPSFH